MKRLEQHASFGGRQEVWQHPSSSTGTLMNMGVYLPPQALAGEKCPVLYWLSGLTCTEQNFITKAGAQQHAARHGLILVAPDTSPRGQDVADDESYDLGQGAGFYVNATQAPWAPHYRMYDYVTQELPALVEANFPATDVRSIFGHSMGGHGALVVALRNPERYRSVSAFAPIVAPSQVPWGQKVLGAYLGDDPQAWKAWDSVALVEALAARRTADHDTSIQAASPHGRAPQTDNAAAAPASSHDGPAGTASSIPDIRLSILVDQGGDDAFLHEQLRPELLEAACAAAGLPLELRLQPGYDHSYYFIASFIGEHIAWHAQALQEAP